MNWDTHIKLVKKRFGLFRNPAVQIVFGLCLIVCSALLLTFSRNDNDNTLSWQGLIAPLKPGGNIADGYRLSPLRRGREQDVVATARRFDGTETVELHIVSRGQWKGVVETNSFGVAYEKPRSTGSHESLQKVTRALAKAIAANDPGGLGPVSAIPLRTDEPVPTITSFLDKLHGLTGIVVSFCLLYMLVHLVYLPKGVLWLSFVLLILGLGLRATQLSLPFLWDQDVQRLQIGASSLSEIFTGVGIDDRHPPFYFVVLHLVQLCGQQEWIVRFPAVILGSLTAPIFLWAVWFVNRKVEIVSALAAILMTFSPELILRAREVSEIPLFSVVLLAMVAVTVKNTEQENSSRFNLACMSVLYALALWLYYMAPFAIAGTIAVLVVMRRLSPRVVKWITGGVLLGLPALVLGVRIFIKDSFAREAAAVHPHIAWGERAIGEMLGDIGSVMVSCCGAVVAMCCVWAMIVSIQHRNLFSLTAFGTFFSYLFGMVALTPFARIQPYYLVGAVPLAFMGIAYVDRLGNAVIKRIFFLLLFLGTVVFLGNSGPTIGRLYVSEHGEFMRSFARTIRENNHKRVVTVAHYDSTLLLYELARLENLRLSSDSIKNTEGQMGLTGLDVTLFHLIKSHSPGTNPDRDAIQRLYQLVNNGPIVVIARESISLPSLKRALSRCELLEETARARLLQCENAHMRPTLTKSQSISSYL